MLYCRIALALEARTQVCALSDTVLLEYDAPFSMMQHRASRTASNVYIRRIFWVMIVEAPRSLDSPSRGTSELLGLVSREDYPKTPCEQG